MSRNLLESLINTSEKAANIARKCRRDVNLLALLVQEKSQDEANPRFVKDFKTLADVLIQETIRHDVGKIFPELRENIKGEETATFTNSLGDSVSIVIGEDVAKTTSCLNTVLDGNVIAADILAHEVHNDGKVCPNDIPATTTFPEDFDYSKLGIWIDPIDATAEYIAGDTIFSNFPGITSTGLDCVTVLIGVYSKETNCPILGVINQPFYKKTDINCYESKIFWGICLDDENKCNNLTTDVPLKPKNVALFSNSEHKDLMEQIKSLNYEVAFTAGAGHKALKVITGEADLYLLSKCSTFKWDTCAPQAILQSLGGGIFDFKKSLKQGKLVPITYDDSDGSKCNEGGIIALKDLNLFENILRILDD